MTIGLYFYGGHGMFNLEISNRKVYTECQAWENYRDEIILAIKQDYDEDEIEEYFSDLVNNDFPQEEQEFIIANTFDDLRDCPNLLRVLKEIMREAN